MCNGLVNLCVNSFGGIRVFDCRFNFFHRVISPYKKKILLYILQKLQCSQCKTNSLRLEWQNDSSQPPPRTIGSIPCSGTFPVPGSSNFQRKLVKIASVLHCKIFFLQKSSPPWSYHHLYRFITTNYKRLLYNNNKVNSNGFGRIGTGRL